MADVLAVLLGLCLYFILFLPASYAICWGAEPFDFRRRSMLFRLCVAQGFSFAVTPYLLFLFYRLATPWLIVLLAAAGVVFIVKTFGHLRWRHAKPALILLLLVAAMALTLVTDWTVGPRTYLSVTAWDYAKHVAVTHALTADRVPPFNPSFAPGHPIPLFYYYFWFLTSSAVEIVSKGLVSARNAVTAGVIYTAFSLLAAVVLSAWLLFPGPRRRNRSRLYLSLTLLLVSGLDLIPFLLSLVSRLLHGQFFSAASLPGSLSWWNEQVTNWPATLLWVPHHAAAFIVLWLLFWDSALQPEAPLRRRWPLILFRAIALVSIFGMSSWMGLLAGAIFALWLAQQAFHRKWANVKEWLVAVLAAGILAAPFLLDLLHAKKTSSATVAFSVRRFFPAQALFDKLDPLLRASHVPGFALKLLHQAVFLFLLPLNYGMELGVFLLAAFLYWRFCRGTAYELRGGRAWWPLLLPCALVVTFLRSSLANNDLGWRAFLPLQITLLLVLVMVWERCAVDGRIARWRTLLVSLAVIGLTSTLCDLALMRVSPMAADLAAPDDPAARTYSRLQAYRRLNASEPAAFYVQHNPKRDVDYESGLFSDRRMVVADIVYGPLYGVDLKLFQPVFDRVTRVFEGCGPDAQEYATEAAVDDRIRFWMFQDNDPVWRDRQCWIWSRPPLYQDSHVLVIAAQ